MELSLLRLLHLVSPTLPIGAFTYSQGMEWAVEAGWVRDESELEAWLEGQMDQGLGAVDLPLLIRLQRAAAEGDLPAFTAWADYLIACRETQELRTEERQRGKALAMLLPTFGVNLDSRWIEAAGRCQAAGFALAAKAWAIPADQGALGYAWGWLENQVLAGIKLIPLGQTAGQRVLHRLTPRLAERVERARALTDDEIGGSLPALAIASSRHEGQYTRLFRS
jgi:urease accessory protein